MIVHRVSPCVEMRLLDCIRLPMTSPAVLIDAQILAEERHYMVLKAVGHGAGVCAMVDLKGIGEPVGLENLMELDRAGLQAVLIAHVDRDCPVLAKVADVLVDERQRSIRRHRSEEHTSEL